MKKIAVILIFAAFIYLIPDLLGADTIYFKNGGTIEGIIKSEDDNSVEMGIGFGTITCAKQEIARIERSTPDEKNALNEKWEKKKEELKVSESQFERERQKRFAEYDKWTREEEEIRAKEASGEKTVDLRRDSDTRSILVDACLNDNVNVTLVLDTGASIVVLTKRVGENLGIDLSDTKNNIATLQLAGDRKVPAKMVMLKSVRIKDIEVKDVLAGVLLEDGGMGFRDGLLGMTFLSKFNLKIDLNNMKMALEKAG